MTYIPHEYSVINKNTFWCMQYGQNLLQTGFGRID